VLPWNAARLEFLAQFILALVKVRTVNLTQIALAFSREAKSDSSYKRIQRFFRFFVLSEKGFAEVMLRLLPPGPYLLTMDRTNWQFGKIDINILTIGVVHQGIAFPLFWTMLSKKGNSNTKERKELIQKVLALLGKQEIKALLADREFVGKEWFAFLRKEGVSFRIRIRENFLIHGSKKRSVKMLLRGLSQGEKRLFPNAMEVCGNQLFISGAFMGKEYCVIVSDIFDEQALETYGKRWEIETLFACLKSRGFCFEETHMTKEDRLHKLVALLGLTLAWMHLLGEWISSKKLIPLKKHGRKAKSIFRIGLDYFRNLLLNMKRSYPLILRCFHLLENFLSCT
jgi:hypothetical protein